MKLYKDEQGITLVELLAAMVILLMFGAIVWGFFSQSLKYNDVEITKQQLKDEANLIITSVQKKHVKAETYKLSAMNSNSSFVIQNQDGSNEYLFNKAGVTYTLYCYESELDCPDNNDSNKNELINTNVLTVDDKDFTFHLELRSSNFVYTIKTSFDRIK